MTDRFVFADADIDARQVAPLTVDDVAAWCGGQVTIDAAGNQGVDVDGVGRADYGWWVVAPAGASDGPFTVVDPAAFLLAHPGEERRRR